MWFPLLCLPPHIWERVLSSPLLPGLHLCNILISFHVWWYERDWTYMPRGEGCQMLNLYSSFRVSLPHVGLGINASKPAQQSLPRAIIYCISKRHWKEQLKNKNRRCPQTLRYWTKFFNVNSYLSFSEKFKQPLTSVE